MRTGVLGGTFNPIHNSHLRLASSFVEQLSLDRVILVPTSIPPHKQAQGLAPAADRLEMCRLAAAGQPGFLVSEYEVAEQGKSFTHKTLVYLSGLYPGDELFLLMGADMFFTVQQWKNPPEIFRLATLCAASREPFEQEKLREHAAILERMGARCAVSDISAEPMSSTEIRELIRSGGDAGAFLPGPVWEYIRKRGLYR